MKRLSDLDALFDLLGPGRTAVLHSGCAEPPWFAAQVAQNAVRLAGTRLFSFMPMGHAPYADEIPASHLELVTFFTGKGLRKAMAAGRVAPLRFPLSEIAPFFDDWKIRADVAMLQVSPPDATGHVSLGVSVDYMPAVLRQAPVVFAEINPNMPRTRGDCLLPVSEIDWFVESQAPILEVPTGAGDAVDRQIAAHVAALVRDGAVLQLGIGSLPDAVLAQLDHLKHLGLHSGIITDAVVPLIASGVIDNSTKTFRPGVSVTTTAAGTRRLYDFLHLNDAVEFHSCSFTHNREVLTRIDGLCAINSALQVDLAGNVNAEEAGGRRISMPGGLPDFAFGASRARNGLSIVALRSDIAGSATGNILPALPLRGLVTVGPEDIDYIVTEYGTARIRGCSAQDRALALTAIAHPSRREALSRKLTSYF